MKSTLLFLLSLALVSSAFAQADAVGRRPLNENDLLKTIDSLGGDPSRKPPLPGSSEARALGEARREKPAESKKKDPQGPTEITAREATFDQKTHQAVFTQQVVVNHPEFDLNCDKLTAYLKNDEKPKAAAASPAPAAPKPAPAKESKGGGLERAIAEGSVVIVQEKPSTSGGPPERSVGKGTKAIYDAATGNLTLYGWPQVQQGFNTCVALEEGTVMIMNREGRMKVEGPSKMVIKESAGESNGR